jgi:hypothetical protein
VRAAAHARPPWAGCARRSTAIPRSRWPWSAVPDDGQAAPPRDRRGVPRPARHGLSARTGLGRPTGRTATVRDADGRRPPSASSTSTAARSTSRQTRRHGAARGGPPALGRPARDPDVPDRRCRQPASGRVVRRPVRAATGPRPTETCAAIASVMLAWRLPLATGDWRPRT